MFWPRVFSVLRKRKIHVRMSTMRNGLDISSIWVSLPTIAVKRSRGMEKTVCMYSGTLSNGRSHIDVGRRHLFGITLLRRIKLVIMWSVFGYDTFFQRHRMCSLHSSRLFAAGLYERWSCDAGYTAWIYYLRIEYEFRFHALSSDIGEALLQTSELPISNVRNQN